MRVRDLVIFLNFGIVIVVSDKLWLEMEFIVGEEEDYIFNFIVFVLFFDV